MIFLSVLVSRIAGIGSILARPLRLASRGLSAILGQCAVSVVLPVAFAAAIPGGGPLFAGPGTDIDAVRVPLRFEPNHGQSGQDVRFVGRSSGALILLSDHGADFVRREPDPCANSPRPGCREEVGRVERFGIRFPGSQTPSAVMGVRRLAGKSNYFLKNNPEKWLTDVPHFSRVRYEELYPGVDLVYRGKRPAAGVRLCHRSRRHARADTSRICRCRRRESGR